MVTISLVNWSAPIRMETGDCEEWKAIGFQFSANYWKFHGSLSKWFFNRLCFLAMFNCAKEA